MKHEERQTDCQTYAAKPKRHITSSSRENFVRLQRVETLSPKLAYSPLRNARHGLEYPPQTRASEAMRYC